MIITTAVLMYQFFFVALMYLGSRIGPRAAVVMMLGALAWTVTHLFFPPLMLLQTGVIVGSWWWFRKARKAQPGNGPA